MKCYFACFCDPFWRVNIIPTGIFHIQRKKNPATQDFKAWFRWGKRNLVSAEECLVILRIKLILRKRPTLLVGIGIQKTITFMYIFQKRTNHIGVTHINNDFQEFQRMNIWRKQKMYTTTHILTLLETILESLGAQQ